MKTINYGGRRILLAAVVITAAAAAPTIAPEAAHAAPPGLALSVHDGGVSEAGKAFSLSLRSTSPDPFRLDHTRLSIDTAEVADFATAWVRNFDDDGKPIPAKNCTTAGTRITCEEGTISSPYGLWLPALVVQAKPGAELGRSGRLTITVSADGLDPITSTPKITVADDVDLAVSIAGEPVTGERGKPVTVPIEITNTGERPVNGAALRIIGFDDLQLFGRYTNCGYDQGDQQVYCRFDEELAAGGTYVLSEPALAVRPKATEDSTYAAQLWTGDDADEVGLLDSLTRGTDGVLRLVRKPGNRAARALTTDSRAANNLDFGKVLVAAVPGESPSASAGPQPSASAGPQPSASGTPAPGTGGGLPITGTQTGLIIIAGATMLLLGGVGVVFARRRRTRFVA